MSVCTVRDAFIFGLILTLAVAVTRADDKPGEAPRTPYYGSGGSTLIFQLAKPGVQEELGFDESESKSLLESLRKIDPKHSSFRTPEERRQISTLSDETKRKSEAAIQKFLSEEQFRRFQQLEMQYLGGRSLLAPETAQHWGLTAEQQERLKTIRSGFAGGESGPSDEEASVRVERYKNDLLAVMTPDQIKQWKATAGVPFKVPKSFSGPSWRLVLVPEVQKELSLSEDGTATLRQSLAAIQTEGYVERSRTGSDRVVRDQADQRRQSQQIIDTVRSTLTVSQWNRLQELILQQTGVESLAHHEVAKELGLSEEQRDRIRDTIDEYRRSLTSERTLSVMPKELQSRRQKEQTSLLDILTPDQKKQWEGMQGAKVDRRSLFKSELSPAGK